MAQTALDEEKLQSALHIIQRIFQDAWLMEERSLLIEHFSEKFDCSPHEVKEFFFTFLSTDITDHDIDASRTSSEETFCF